MRKYLLLAVSILTFFISLTGCSKDSTKSKFQLTVEVTEGGSVDNIGGIYDQGTKVILLATPDPGYVFKYWEGIESISPKIEISINDDILLKAVFALNVKSINDSVPYIVEDLVDKSGYRFFIENGGTECYLVDELGNMIHQWEFDMNLGQDIELSDDGNLFGMFKIEDPTFSFGGASGLIRRIDKNSNLLWEYRIADDDNISHHDLEIMPNGNLLVLVWQRITSESAQEVGFETTEDIFVEKIIELNPSKDEIVWEWNSWDHIVQNKNILISNYGEPQDHPEKIDILYNFNSDVHQFVAQGDIMHANGLSYNPDLDIIAISVNFYSEVWFIDHSTTTEESKTDTGGNYQRGGDLIYRLGNPKTHGKSNDQLLDFNHHPSFVNTESSTNLLIFNNNNTEEISKIMEFRLPDLNDEGILENNPELIFLFSDNDLFHPRVSGAVRLPNGNTLICEGDYGYWEVNPNGIVLWKYDGKGQSFWRGLFYPKDSEAIISLNL